MPLVKDDGMPECDGLAVVRLIGKKIEERSRAGARAAIPIQCGVSVESHSFSLYAKIERLQITLNGDAVELAGPLTVAELLTRFEIDPRRVAVEHNLTVLKRAAFTETIVREGDRIEVVNFVGGGAA